MAHQLYRLLIVRDFTDGMPHLAELVDQPDFERIAVTGPEAALAAVTADKDIDLVLLVTGCCLRAPGSLMRRLRELTDASMMLAAECPDSGVCALEQGADEWVPHSVNPRELLLRLRNLAARAKMLRQRPRLQAEPIEFSGWRLDRERRELTSPDGESIHLTGVEAALLSTLAVNAGRPLDREWLQERICGRDLAPNSRTIDVTIAQLRRKLGDDSRRPRFIVTMHGKGYRFTAEPGDTRPDSEEARS